MPRLPTSQKLLLTVAIAGVLALPGCKRAGEAIAEKAIEQASGDKVDIKQDGDTVSIKTEQGEMKVATAQDGGSVALPADFPTDVFLPEPRTVSSAMDMGGMKAVNIATSAALAQVSADVEKSMQGQGWKREMSMPMIVPIIRGAAEATEITPSSFLLPPSSLFLQNISP